MKPPNVALIMFTDGRDHVFDLDRIASWARIEEGCGERLIFDDSDDRRFRARLLSTFEGWTVTSWGERLGFGGSIRRAWELLAADPTISHLFHLEDDFRLIGDVDLNHMVGLLERHPHLVQVALKRQAWNDTEIAAGGIVECNPHAYDQSGDEYAQWLEHRLFFTTNPSVYRRSLCGMTWPKGAHSEGVFTHGVLREGSPEASADKVRFAFLGKRYAPNLVEHFGRRAGIGY